MAKIGPNSLAGFEIYFRGTPAEAEEFRRINNVPSRVMPDPTSQIFSKFSIETCPAFRIVDGGSVRIVGNGKAISEQQLAEISRSANDKG